MTLKTKPYVFQIKAARKLHEWNGSGILIMDPGLGKSLTSLMYVSRHQTKALPMLVICPASIKFNWQRECMKHLGWKATVLEGQSPPKGKFTTNDPVVIINYDVLSFWLEKLIPFGFKTIVIDECQNLMHSSSKKTKATKIISRGVPHIIPLSGTPLMNRPSEMFNVLHMLRPKLFPTEWSYWKRFCNLKRRPWGWEHKGAKNIEELHAMMTDPKTGCAIRVRKQDVLSELPAKRRIIVPLPISNRKEYEHAKNDFVSWLALHDINRLSSAQRATMMVKQGYLIRLVGEGKLKAVKEWISSFTEESDSKLCVFGIHKKVLGGLNEHFKGSLKVDGSVTGKKRDNAFELFKHGRPQLLFAQLLAAGVGWSAENVNNFAFAEFGWRPADHTQAEDRGHGIGRGVKGQQTDCWWLVAHDTIEEDLIKMLDKKSKVLGMVLDGRSDGGDALDIHTQLALKMLKGKRK